MMTTPDQGMTSDAAAAAIASQIEGVDEETVRKVLAAQVAIAEGDPLRTIRRDPATGDIAVRVAINGIHKWRRVEVATGWTGIEENPTLALPVLYEPTADELGGDTPPA